MFRVFNVILLKKMLESVNFFFNVTKQVSREIINSLITEGELIRSIKGYSRIQGIDIAAHNCFIICTCDCIPGLPYRVFEVPRPWLACICIVETKT